MPSAFILDGLRMHLKARGMTYADVGKALKISEATVKRIFSTGNCTLERLDAICELAQVDVMDLARGAPREDRLINRLSREQEQEIVADPKLMLVAVCAIHQLRVEEIVRLYKLDQAQCVKLVLRLERIGILEVHENNRIRLRLARTFAWLPDGPIMRQAKAQLADFFDYAFGDPGELMRMMTVRISRDAQVALLRRLENVVREYAEQHSADARLPLDQRHELTILLAARPWEAAAFRSLRRKA